MNRHPCVLVLFVLYLSLGLDMWRVLPVALFFSYLCLSW